MVDAIFGHECARDVDILQFGKCDDCFEVSVVELAVAQIETD